MPMRRLALAPCLLAALAARDASAADPDDSALAQHAQEVVRYTLAATLDPAAHKVHGEGTLAWRNTSTVAVREVWLHLYLNAFKNERSVFLRTPHDYGRGGAAVKDWGSIDVSRLVLLEGPDGKPANVLSGMEKSRPGDADETDARVPLPRDVVPGEAITLDMAWDAKLPSVVERTGYDGSLHMVAQWFPKIARLEPDGTWAHFPFYRFSEFYADFGSYDVTLDVPQAFTVGATGPLVESRIERGRRVERHVQGDIHDFAWTAWDRWQSLSETIDGVSVVVLHPPGFRVDAQRELATLRFALPYFGRRYGRYPYSVLTAVHPPQSASEMGGMEYPTLITTGGAWYGPPGIRTIELVTAHEFGHQYFYGLLASNENKWPFLDEGLNSFAEADALESWLGPRSVAGIAGLALSDVAVQSALANVAANDERIAQPAPSFVTGLDYGALVYYRTAAILETLRRVYGDEAFSATFARYARKYRFTYPAPDALLGVIEEGLGAAVAANLRVALFERGWVDYAILSIDSRETHDPRGIFDREDQRGTAQSLYEGSVVVSRRGNLSFPVDVELTHEDGMTERVRWNGDTDIVRIPYSGASPLRAAVVDPDERVLVDASRRNNFDTARSVARAGTARTSEHLVYWAELALQQILP